VEAELKEFKNVAKIGEYIAILYTTEGDAMGTLHGNDLTYLIDHLKTVTIETNCTYILLEIIDNFSGKTVH